MKNASKILKNTSYLMISEVVIKGLGLVWVLVLTSQLSVEEYGQYSFVNAFMTIAAIVADLGMGNIFIREIAQRKEKAPVYLGYFFSLGTVFALGVSAIVMLMTVILGYDGLLKTLFLVSSLSLVLSTIRAVALAYFSGVEKLSLTALSNSLNSVLLIGGGLCGLVVTGSLLGVFSGMLTGVAISVAISLGILHTQSKITLRMDKKELKTVLSHALPVGLASIASVVYMKIDSVMIGHLLTNTDVGIYNAATPLVFALIQILNIPFVISLYPRLSVLYASEITKFWSFVKQSVLGMVIWNIVIGTSVFFLAPFIVHILFGEEYVQAGVVLRILALSLPFASLSALFMKVLLVMKKQQAYLWVSLAGAGLNIVLNTALIPAYSLQGAAVASVVTQVTLVGVYIAVIRRRENRHTSR